MHEIITHLRTLTAVWTGDASRHCPRITSQGLIGSLRWWAEVLARGAGLRIDDPTMNPPIYDPDVGEMGLDVVSRLFGATGWRRRFRLIVAPHEVEPRPADDWSGVRSADVPVRLIGSREADLRVVESLLAWVCRRGAVGARWRLGSGVVEMKEPASLAPLREWLEAETRRREAARGPGELPRLDRMVFAQLRGAPGALDRSELKRIVKEVIRAKKGMAGVIFLMGSLETGGCKIAVSEAYAREEEQEMRLWAWIPTMSQPADRSDLLSALKLALSGASPDVTLAAWDEVQTGQGLQFPKQKGAI